MRVIGETLICAQVTDNPYAIRVTKSSNVVGHLPKKINSTCSLGEEAPYPVELLEVDVTQGI